MFEFTDRLIGKWKDWSVDQEIRGEEACELDHADTVRLQLHTRRVLFLYSPNDTRSFKSDISISMLVLSKCVCRFL